MELRKFLLILTITLVVLLAILLWFFPSNQDFRIENSFWNGAKDFSLTFPAKPLASLSDLPTSPAGTTLILIPYLNFSTTELEELNNFVTQGGTLVLADDYGWGNQILGYLGLKARFSEQPLLDLLSNYRNKWFPRIFYFEASPLTTNVKSLVFNHATSLTDIESSNAIALSSAFSFIDLNGNGDWDKDEPAGPLPVISSHSLGRGRIILIADPSIFINSMQTVDDNLTFIQNLTATSSLFIDQSHLPLSNLYQTKNLLANIRSFLITSPVTFGATILVILGTLIPIWRRRTYFKEASPS